MSSASSLPCSHPDAIAKPGRQVTTVGLLMAAWCTGFAIVNVVFELTDHFANAALAAYAPAISLMDWTVVCLKLLGAAVALLAVTRLPRQISPTLVGTLVWGATALLALYSVGNVLETIGMVTGLAGSLDQITLRSIGYVLFFAVGAVGYGVLATSFSRRYDVPKRAAVLGALGAPVMLALILLALPALFVAKGLMPG